MVQIAGRYMSRDIAKIFCKFCKGKIDSESLQEYANGYHDDCYTEIKSYRPDPVYQFKDFLDLYEKSTGHYNDFRQGVELTDLYLDKLGIGVLSDSIGCFYNLKLLSLNENKLSDLPLTINNSLKVLNLNNNNFSTIPDLIFSFDDLIALELNDNKITTIPAAIGNLTNLQSLDLANNQISSVPQSIKNLEHLMWANLSGNNFSTFPQELANLNLERLDLSNNKIISIPKAIKNMGVNNLILDDNLLTTLPDEMGELEYTYKLSLKQNKLNRIPASLGYEFSFLEELNIENNELTDLPDSLTELPLKNINLNNNKFIKIPDCIFGLEKLTYFYFNNMQLLKIPKEFFRPNLEWIEFANCGLKSIPDSIELSTKLHSLIVPFNDLTELPDSSRLPSLSRLDITNNPIKKLPDELCTKLFSLGANNTKLESLPESMDQIVLCHLRDTNIHSLPDFNPDKDPKRYIRILDIRDTHIKNIPESISDINIWTICISKNDSLKGQLKDYFKGTPNADHCIIDDDPKREYYNKWPSFTPKIIPRFIS